MSDTPMHYGPWVITFTDGETGLSVEVNASTEQDAILKAHDQIKSHQLPSEAPVRAFARRV